MYSDFQPQQGRLRLTRNFSNCRSRDIIQAQMSKGLGKTVPELPEGGRPDSRMSQKPDLIFKNAQIRKRQQSGQPMNKFLEQVQMLNSGITNKENTEISDKMFGELERKMNLSREKSALGTRGASKLEIKDTEEKSQVSKPFTLNLNPKSPKSPKRRNPESYGRSPPRDSETGAYMSKEPTPRMSEKKLFLMGERSKLLKMRENNKKLNKQVRVEEANEQKQFHKTIRIYNILVKDHQHRTPEEIEEVARLLMQIQFFKERQLGEKDLVDLTKILSVEDALPGDEVITYGEQGDKFYIILKGSVSVLVPNQKIRQWRLQRFQYNQNIQWKQEQDEKYIKLKMQERIKKQTMALFARKPGSPDSGLSRLMKKTTSPGGQGSPIKGLRSRRLRKTSTIFGAALLGGANSPSKSPASFDDSDSEEASIQRKLGEIDKEDLYLKLNYDYEEIKKYEAILREIENPQQWFVQVVRLSAGKSFGELALLNDAPRAATIQCLDDCLFATIGRKNYEKALKNIEWRNIQKKVDFFKSLPFLHRWTKNQIRKIVYSFNEYDYLRNQTVFHQGDQAQFIYIVKDGEFEVRRERRKKHEVQSTDKRKDEQMNRLGIDTFTKKVKNNEQNVNPNTKMGFSMNLKKDFLPMVVLKQLCSGQMFGDEDVVNSRRCTTTVKCTSTNGTLYSIKADEFIAKFSKDDRTWKIIKEIAELKEQELKKNLHLANKSQNIKFINSVVQKQMSKKAKTPFRGSTLPANKDQLPSKPLETEVASHHSQRSQSSLMLNRKGSFKDSQATTVTPMQRRGSEEKFNETNRSGGVGKGYLKRHKKYSDILSRHNMKVTLDRVQDFRVTLKEIIDVKNGRKQADFEPSDKEFSKTRREDVPSKLAQKKQMRTTASDIASLAVRRSNHSQTSINNPRMSTKEDHPYNSGGEQSSHSQNYFKQIRGSYAQQTSPPELQRNKVTQSVEGSRLNIHTLPSAFGFRGTDNLEQSNRRLRHLSGHRESVREHMLNIQSQEKGSKERSDPSNSPFSLQDNFQGFPRVKGGFAKTVYDSQVQAKQVDSILQGTASFTDEPSADTQKPSALGTQVVIQKMPEIGKNQSYKKSQADPNLYSQIQHKFKSNTQQPLSEQVSHYMLKTPMAHQEGNHLSNKKRGDSAFDDMPNRQSTYENDESSRANEPPQKMVVYDRFKGKRFEVRSGEQAFNSKHTRNCSVPRGRRDLQQEEPRRIINQSSSLGLMEDNLVVSQQQVYHPTQQSAGMDFFTGVGYSGYLHFQTQTTARDENQPTQSSVSFKRNKYYNQQILKQLQQASLVENLHTAAGTLKRASARRFNMRNAPGQKVKYLSVAATFKTQKYS